MPPLERDLGSNIPKMACHCITPLKMYLKLSTLPFQFLSNRSSGHQPTAPPIPSSRQNKRLGCTMRLACCGQGPVQCLILKFCSTTILLDCRLDVHSIYSFKNNSSLENSDAFWEASGAVWANGTWKVKTPLLAVASLHPIDEILVSDPTGLLALPYLLKDAKLDAQVHVTSPCLEIACNYYKELLDLSVQESSDVSPFVQLGSLPEGLNEQHILGTSDTDLFPLIKQCWRQIFSKEDVHNCLMHCKGVNYFERISLGGDSVLAEAVPSGSGLGGCVWKLQGNGKRLAYISDACFYHSHARELEICDLKGLDAMVIGSTLPEKCDQKSDRKLVDEESFTEKIERIQELVKMCVTRSRVLLIAVPPNGIVFDLAEEICALLLSLSMHFVPVIYASPIAKSLLHLGLREIDFLKSDRRERIYKQRPPFRFDELIQTGQLRIQNDLSEAALQNIPKPSVVLVPSSSLIHGIGARILKRWGPIERQFNTVIFTEEVSQHSLSRIKSAINGPLIHVPLYFKLVASEIVSMLESTMPKNVVIGKVLAQSIGLNPRSAEQMGGMEEQEWGNVHTFDTMESVKVHLKAKAVPLFASPDFLEKNGMRMLKGARSSRIIFGAVSGEFKYDEVEDCWVLHSTQQKTKREDLPPVVRGAREKIALATETLLKAVQAYGMETTCNIFIGPSVGKLKCVHRVPNPQAELKFYTSTCQVNITTEDRVLQNKLCIMVASALNLIDVNQAT